MSKKNNAPQLRRTMTAGQMEMISLGGELVSAYLWGLRQQLSGLVLQYFWPICLWA